MPLNDKKLIQLRVSKGLSQNEVAKCLNISQATISYIESGKHSDVKIKQVEALAEFYGVTVHYLLDYIEPREREEHVLINKTKESIVLSLNNINDLIRSKIDKIRFQ